MGGTYGIFTTNDDGRKLYAWMADGHGGTKYIGVAKTDGTFEKAHRDNEATKTLPAK
jgi:hypothetical protein